MTPIEGLLSSAPSFSFLGFSEVFPRDLVCLLGTIVANAPIEAIDEQTHLITCATAERATSLFVLFGHNDELG
jgi:hypothetical protein